MGWGFYTWIKVGYDGSEIWRWGSHGIKVGRGLAIKDSDRSGFELGSRVRIVMKQQDKI